MKKKVLISVFSIVAILLFSCSSEKSDSIEKKNILDIVKSESNLSNYDNLSIECTIDLPKVDKLFSFSIEGNMQNDSNENSEENKLTKERFKLLVEDYSGKKVKEDEISFNVAKFNHDNSIDVSLEYIDTSTSLQYSYSPNGWFSIHDINITNDVHNAECKSYSFINDAATISLNYEIESFSAQEALDLCNREVVNKLMNSIPEDELVPHSIASYTFDDGSSSYCIIYAKKKNGLILSEAGEFAFVDSGFIKPTYVAVQVNEKKNIYSIINFYPNVYDEVSKKEIEDGSFISINDAMELLSKYLAENKKYTVESVDMVYFLPTRMKENTSNLVYTEYIPGYEVVLESRKSTQMTLFPRMTAYIDMISGKIYISDSINQIQFFELN